jgi:hypothetical protein
MPNSNQPLPGKEFRPPSQGLPGAPVFIAAIHGILTRQTDPSWPDRLDAWLYRRDPGLRVLKKEYRAGPFPRWNCWVKDPLLAKGLAAEIELLLASPAQSPVTAPTPEPWIVAHSNGAVIALLTTRRLIDRGARIGGLILTGAACQADLAQNGVLDWIRAGQLGWAIAYSSRDDRVLPAGPLPGAGCVAGLRAALWRALTWPWGSLGRTGWLHHGRAPEPGLAGGERILTRWFSGGHSAYFDSQHGEPLFEQLYKDITQPRPLENL